MASLMIDTEWIGASDPSSVAAKDYRGLLTLVEEACRWVLDCMSFRSCRAFNIRRA